MKINITEVKKMIDNGFVRYTRQKNSDNDRSIQEHYGLTNTETNNLFQLKNLKGYRKKSNARIITIVDEGNEKYGFNLKNGKIMDFDDDQDEQDDQNNIDNDQSKENINHDENISVTHDMQTISNDHI